MLTDPPAHASDHADALRSTVGLGLFFAAATAAWYVWTLHAGPTIPRDGSTLVVGRDFLNTWMAGRATRLPDPGRWYDASAYQAALAALLGPGYPGQNWSYPPTVMLLAAPFGRLGYLPALACWTGLGLAIFVATVRSGALTIRPLVAMLASPAAVFCLISGQSSLLTAAAMVGIFALLDRRPAIAGVLIGCLTLKPQLGVLFPVMLAASGRWRAFAAAAATALLLAGLTTMLFGTEPWTDFLLKGLPVQNIVLTDPEGIATPFYPTVFMNLRGIGASYLLAMAVQGAVALAAAALVGWAFARRRDMDRDERAILFLACSVAATPYLLAYDTLPLAVAMLTALGRGALDARGRLLAKLVFWLPLIQMGLGGLHIPGGALIAPAVALHVAARLRGRQASVAAAPPFVA